MEEVIVSICEKISGYALAPVTQELGYIWHYKTNVAKLATEIQNLTAAEVQIQDSVKKAIDNAEEIRDDVRNLLARVTKINKEAEDFFKHGDHANSMCSCKFFHLLVSRHRLSKKAEAMAKGVRDATQSLSSQKVSHDVPPKDYDIEVGHEGYMTFPSRISTFKKIVDALRNPNVWMIGVYGMAGVGKTILAKEVARQAKEEKLLNKVVMVSISQSPDVKKIQKEIAEQLGGLKLDEETVSVRAERLHRRLSQETNILLVLDDVWEKPELHQLGITFGIDKNRCKILVTSRFQDVVQNDMGVEKIFRVDELSLKEAKGLFGKIVGDSMVNNQDFQDLATQIVKECGGLPIAIETVANALKNKTVSIWQNALQELRTRTSNIKRMHDKVYNPIELSYKCIESDEAKLMLFYIGLYPKGCHIPLYTLLVCGIGLELFQGIRELEEAENKVDALVQRLKTACFLTDGAHSFMVKMHDIIHDVVTSIGSQEKKMFSFKNYVPEREDSRKLKDATAISLLYSSDDSQLPERLECPQLKFLLVLCYDLSLWKNRYSQISNQFFEEMKGLRVLELNALCLKTLPLSFLFLQKLQCLGLYFCDLGDVALIGELKSLKILKIVDSNIVELPKQIGQLTRLQLLIVSNCPNLEVIHHNVIASLVRLEEFCLHSSFTKWDTNGGNCNRRNASLTELKNLSLLSALYIDIPDVNIVPKDLFCMKLKKYQIFIGRFSTQSHYMFNVPSSNFSRILGLDQLDITRLKDDAGLEMLLEKSEVLILHRLKVANNLVYDLDAEGFSKLKHLIIVNNYETVYIINSMEQNNHNSVFLSLQLLHLEKLMNLEKICHGKLSADSFGKLRVVKVRECDRLKNLFSFSIAKQLEEIEVVECKMLREIVYLTDGDPSIESIPTEATAKLEFPQLRSLIMESLPELIHFSDSELVNTITSQRKEGHPIPLFNLMVAFPGLTYLVLSTLDSEMLWPDQLPETFNMQNLTTLTVIGCNSLKHVSSFAMAKCLVQLERLEVSQCSVMEELMAINDNGDPERMNKKLLPNLKYLGLKGLPNLKRFCTKSCLQLPSMVELIIDACPEFEVVDLLGELKNLEILRLAHLDIVELTKEIGQLTRLQLLTLTHCPKLERIEPHIISSLISLEELNIEGIFKNWETGKSNACLSEVKSLAHLSTLRMAIPDVNSLPKDLFRENLETYNINIGEDNLTFVKFGISKKLELKLETSSLLDEHASLKMLMKGSEELCLNGLEGVNNVVYDLDWEGFPKLKFFQFQNNGGIQYIINSVGKSLPCSAFISLETLVFQKLVNLEKICHGKLTDKCFAKLRKIDVSNCNRLKSLFSLSEARILSQLQEIKVAECNMMEEIVIHDNQNISNKVANEIEFPELYSLKLKSLPKFKQVFTEMKTNGTFQGREEELVATNFPIPFFNQKVKFPKLKALTLKGFATPNTIWNFQHEGQFGDDKEQARIVSSLEGLKLRELPQMMHLWEENYSPAQGRAFQNLKYLLVSRCDRLKNLVPCSISFQNLRYLRLSECNGMEYLFTSSTAKSLTQLRYMAITECRRMIHIVGDHQKGSHESESEIVFSCLRILVLDNLPSLTSFCSGNNRILGFPILEVVILRSCCQMQSFCDGQVSTPKLKKLGLGVTAEVDGYDSDRFSVELEYDSEDENEDEEGQSIYEDPDRPTMQLKEGGINATIRQLSESGPADT